MNKILKYSLIGLAALGLVAVAVAVYVAARFDPNAYKPTVVQLVQDRLQRTLTIPGVIDLSFFPQIGVKVGRVTLSEPGSDREFASVDELRVSLALIPLLRKQFQVDDVYVKGLRANLLRSREGHLNIDDLLGAKTRAAPAPAPVQEAGLPFFAVSSITIDKGALTFRDEKADASYAVNDLDLKTGRIANDTPSTVDLSATLIATQPKLDLAAQLKTSFSFNLEQRRYSLKEIALEAKGEAAGLTNLVAKLEGSADADLIAPAIEASKLAFAASGKRDQDVLDAALALPRLKLTREKVDGERMELKAVIKHATGATSIKLSAPRVEGNVAAFKVMDLVLDVDAARPDQVWKAHVTGPVEGQLDNATLKPALVRVNPLTVQATLSGSNIPNKSATGAFMGSAFVDLEKQRVETDLTGTFDESNIKAKVGVAGFSPPSYSFDIEVDKLDLTRYPPSSPATTPATAPAGAQKPPPEQPIDLSLLRALNANGSIRVGSLKAPKIKASNVRIDVKAQDGRVNIDPLAANLYGGSLNGAIGVNAQGTPRFSVKQNLAGVSIAPLLTDVANFQRLEGRGNLSLNVTTAGQTVSQLKKALNGTAAANLADGAIRGIDIGATIREAKTTLAQLKGQQQTAAADTSQKTDFAELRASFHILNGVASNRDLVFSSRALRVAGEGDIDLGNDRMNYLLKAQLTQGGSARIGETRVDLAAVTIPVQVTGPLDAPTYQFDFAELAASAAGQAVQDQIEKKLGGKLPPGAVGDVLQDAVKGFFKR